MNAMTSASSQPLVAEKRLTALTGVQTSLAFAALMLGVALAGAALVVASIAVPLGLLMQAVMGDQTPKGRRGWQPVTA